MVRLLLALALAMTLTGCDNEARREADALREKLESQYGKRQAEIAELERRAAIAQACDYILPTCPDSMTEPGYDAIRHGFSGGGFLFWALAAAKLAALLAAAGAGAGAAGWVWARLSRPALDDVEQAKKLIAEASAAAEASRREAANWAQKATTAKAEVEKLAAAADKLRAEAAALEQQISDLRKIRDLLTGL